jgi:hypothetical protein
MTAHICRRCLRRCDELPSTAMCSGTRAPHVWVDEATTLGRLIGKRRELADQQAAERAIAAAEPGKGLR